MQIQIITTEEQMQGVFSRALDRAVQSFPLKETQPEPIILTGEQLKDKLDVTIQTLIRWRQKGKIPYLQIGASIRYDLNKVLDALTVGNKKKGALTRG
jgi:hypothetical protein